MTKHKTKLSKMYLIEIIAKGVLIPTDIYFNSVKVNKANKSNKK